MVAIAKRAFSAGERSRTARAAFYAEDDEVLSFESDECEALAPVECGLSRESIHRTRHVIAPTCPLFYQNFGIKHH